MLRLIIFLLLNTISTVFSNKNYKLMIYPKENEISKPEKKTFVLKCQGTNHDPNYFTGLRWLDPKDNEILDNKFYEANYKVLKDKDNSIILYFKNPTEALSGNYKCKGFIQNTEELSNSVNVKFFQDITWEDCPKIQFLIKGEKDAIIRCKVNVKPPPTFIWKKDNKNLPNNYIQDNNGIKIGEIVNENMEGTYDVEAFVFETGSFKQNSIVVKIHVKPTIIELQPSFEVIEDEQAQLSCKATGIPPPQYYWLDSSKRNLSSVRGYIVDKDTGSLIILKVNKLEVQGDFTCIVENSAGSVSKKTIINVLSKPKILSFANLSSDVGSINSFNCIASGNPLPQIVIKKDGELNSITSGGNFNVEQSIRESETKLTLTINNIQRIDDGLYYCFATNKIGKVNTAGHLQVEFKPDLSKTPLNIKTWSNRNVNISCVVEAIPNATVTWYFENSLIFNNKYYSINNPDFLSSYKSGLLGVHYLLIKPEDGYNRDIYGNYTCLAKNKHGESKAIIKLSRAYVPSMPSDVDLNDDSPNSIIVRFLNPIETGGLPIKKIFIKYREKYEPSHNFKIKEFQFDKEYVLSGLVPRKIYILNFAAENDVGLSEFTRDFEKLMPNEKPPDLPVFLYDASSKYNYLTRPLESVFSDRFDVRWTIPNDNGRKIENYSIKYYLVIRTTDKWHRISDIKELFIDPNDQLIYHLSELKPNSTYEVELRAKNSEGYSQPSKLVFKTSLHVPVLFFHEKIKKAMTDLTMMIIIIIITVFIALIVLDIILYIRYDYGILYYFIHICITDDESKDKIKNVEPKKGYSYHCTNEEIKPMMLDEIARIEFKNELESILRMPKHSAV